MFVFLLTLNTLTIYKMYLRKCVVWSKIKIQSWWGYPTRRRERMAMVTARQKTRGDDGERIEPAVAEKLGYGEEA